MVKKSSAPKTKIKDKLDKSKKLVDGADLKKEERPKNNKPKKHCKPVGRPSEVESKSPQLIEFIRAGNPYSTSCACATVSYRSFLEWMQYGRQHIEDGNFDHKYARFARDVEKAKADAQKEVLSHWLNAVPHNWQAAKEYLARVNPEEWGSKEKIDVTSNGESIGKPIFLPLKDDDDG